MTKQQKVVTVFSMDFTSETQWAKRQDGQWFKRDKYKDPRYGYRWLAWTKSATEPYKHVVRFCDEDPRK